MARRRRRWSGILLAAPMTAYVAVFFIAPLVLLAVYSVMKFDLLTFQVRSGFTLENYRELFSGTYVGAVLRSLAMTLVMTAVCVVLGFPVALTIARASGRTKALLLVAVIVPYWISFVVRTYAWLELLSPTGVVSKVAAFFGIVPEGAQLGYSTFAIGVGMVAGYLPLMILPMFMALDRIDPALHEAAADMGLSRRRAFWKVTAKLAMPGSIAGVLLVGIPATGVHDPCHPRRFQDPHGRQCRGRAIPRHRQLPVRRRHRNDADGRHARRALRLAQAPGSIGGHHMKRRVSPAAAVTVAVLAFLYLPIGMVIVNAFNADESLVGWGGATLEWITGAFADERVREDFLTSCLIALLSTVVAVALSLAAVMAVSRLPKRAGAVLQTLTYARLMIPEVVIAAGILVVIQRLGLSTGTWSVVAGHIVFCSAYATLVLQSRFATLTGTYDEAAADLGAPPRRVFLKVLWPMMMPAVVIAALLSFTFSFDDVVSTVFLAGPETETLPVLILSLSRHGTSPEINAIAVAFMFVSLVLMCLVALASFWPSKQTRSVTSEEEEA
ncbi:ABC transporter permease subunit [Rhodococcus hoagii]|nr:ABC transporter permease subunit [Prescottella equi]